jgi:hypothetical protein
LSVLSPIAGGVVLKIGFSDLAPFSSIIYQTSTEYLKRKKIVLLKTFAWPTTAKELEHLYKLGQIRHP